MGKKILMIIAPRDFRDEELLHPKQELERAGMSVTIASTVSGPVRGMLGATVRPDLTLDRVSVGDYDAVIFVGGIGSSAYFNDRRAHSIANEASKLGKKVCAICIAPVTLANAGLLKGKRATVWSSPADDSYVRMVEAKGAKFTGKPVEVDGNVITARGPDAAREFGRVLVKELG